MRILCELAGLYQLVVVLRAISSFFPITSGSPLAPVVSFLYKITEPVFAPIRRVLPAMGGFDFTPLVVIIGINILTSILGC
ncbi:MAG: YggT family protein [Actinomycetes bacterium]|jgi:YggT family protein